VSLRAPNRSSNAVRRVRRAAEMTQRELADAVGVSRQTIVSIETSDYAPSVYLALRIAATLRSTVEELFDPHEDPS
jgi:putative transcriptional regulator